MSESINTTRPSPAALRADMLREARLMAEQCGRLQRLLGEFAQAVEEEWEAWAELSDLAAQYRTENTATGADATGAAANTETSK